MNHDSTPGDGVPLPKGKARERRAHAKKRRTATELARRMELHHLLPVAARECRPAPKPRGD